MRVNFFSTDSVENLEKTRAAGIRGAKIDPDSKCRRKNDQERCLEGDRGFHQQIGRTAGPKTLSNGRIPQRTRNQRSTAASVPLSVQCN